VKKDLILFILPIYFNQIQDNSPFQTRKVDRKGKMIEDYSIETVAAVETPLELRKEEVSGFSAKRRTTDFQKDGP
jgi:hypothetical protein